MENYTLSPHAKSVKFWGPCDIGFHDNIPPVERKGCTGNDAGIDKTYPFDRVATLAYEVGANIIVKNGKGKWYLKQCPKEEIEGRTERQAQTKRKLHNYKMYEIEWKDVFAPPAMRDSDSKKVPVDGASSNISKMYMVRISPTRQRPTKDFKILQEEIKISGEGRWDKDHNNKMKVGDDLAFIVGPNPNPNVHFFKIKAGILNRASHWASHTPYTTGNGICQVKHRQTVQLTKSQSYETMTWAYFKASLELAPNCSTYMPRGTMVATKKHLLDARIGNT